MTELAYDETYKGTYNYWKCKECKNGFYGGGSALHKSGCSQKDYSNCVCVIGPEVVAHVKEWAKEHGEEDQVPLSPVSLKDIKEQLPQVL